MRISAQKVNATGIRVSKSKTAECIEKYTKQYNTTCERLYELGYLSTRGYFYDDEFWSSFLEEYPELRSYFLNKRVGSMVYSLHQIDYVILLNINEEASSVLRIVKDAIVAKQAIADINEFCDHAKFQKKSDILMCKSNLSVSNQVSDLSKFNFNSPYVRECIFIEEGKSLVECSYNIEILKTMLKDIEESVNINLEDDSVLLGVGFKISDDCRFLSSIINGDIEGNGKYAKRVNEYIESYYSDFYLNRTTVMDCEGYYEKIFLASRQNAIDLVNQFRKTLGSYEEFFATSESVIFKVDSKDNTRSPQKRDIYIGTYLVDRDTGKDINVMNRLLGFSGEFVSEDASGYAFSGMPVKMYSTYMNKNKTVLNTMNYYPILSVKDESGLQVFPKVNNTRSFYSVKEMLDFLEVDSLETLDQEVSDLIDKSKDENIRQLIGVLVQSLVCIMCDYTLNGHESPNHVVLTGDLCNISEESYLEACICAESFFYKLGF